MPCTEFSPETGSQVSSTQVTGRGSQSRFFQSHTVWAASQHNHFFDFSDSVSVPFSDVVPPEWYSPVQTPAPPQTPEQAPMELGTSSTQHSSLAVSAPFSDRISSQTQQVHFDLAADDTSPRTPHPPSDGEWCISDNYVFQHSASAWVLSKLNTGDSIRKRTDDPSAPRRLAQWREGYVFNHNVLSGMFGIRWLNCAGPLGTIADEVTYENIDTVAILAQEFWLLHPA